MAVSNSKSSLREPGPEMYNARPFRTADAHSVAAAANAHENGRMVLTKA